LIRNLDVMKRSDFETPGSRLTTRPGVTARSTEFLMLE
jgi:hypothetical protein